MEEKNRTTTMQPIHLTPGAVRALKAIEKEQDIPKDYGLRVGVKGGGCSGFSYVLGFDQQTEKDEVYEVEGIRVLIEKSHFMYLAG
ncbi:MAG TPA: iron-sulfur cluster assembly accessory protein, partial [Bacteroidetes bacterium]|nr:iron-sulfur cluster assembly accessory protein [Bacteroidota bacterium]